jgi:glutamate dehydrogenase (NAD(P)+)
LQLDEVLSKLEKKMKESFLKVMETEAQRNADIRTAAFIIAIERLVDTHVQRGIFP